ncbi:carbohydrate esterase family 3 protein [Cadophora sp. MPI-SDFR-AT-0126]|nr:carbohydrate esterase family 3 protein [Leotiomycetes sp. MPI-SDFR-AT-0126]
MAVTLRKASSGACRSLRCVLTYSFLLFLASVRAASDASSTSTTPSTIAFSSAVHLASSLAWEASQIVNRPVLPLPKNITAVPEYEAVSKIAPGLPPIQAGIVFPEAEDMIAKLVAMSNGTGPSIQGRDRRQSGLRVMVVGDSMTHGQQGDYTWRYRIWQFFKNNGVNVQFVGPYTGTMQPMEAEPPQPPPLYGTQAPDAGPQTSGGYAADVDPAFLSNSNHFAVWGRAVAVDKGLIQGVLQANPADLILFMLGFNDMGWFYSDADGTINSVDTFITNARAANPNIKIALANVPQRSFIGGRQDLIDSTTKYNAELSGYIAKWNTAQSPIRLVHLEEAYDCHPASCPAGYDGLHPNAWGEYQIASAFSETLVNDFGIGTTVLAVPAQDDSSLVRPLPGVTNLRVFSSPQGVSATWDPVYGAYSYDVQVAINGGEPFYQFSPTSVASNRWDCQWPLDGWTYSISVRPRAGPTRQGTFSGTLSAIATPQLADPPQNVNVEPTADGFSVTWDPPGGANSDSIVEYNVIYWDTDPNDCQFISGTAFKSSPAVITGLEHGKNYLVAPVTWNKNGQGLPFIANHVVPGAGKPPSPGGLAINANDPTTAHITWTGTGSTGGYHLWARNVNEAGSKFTIAANVTDSCADIYFLFPGIWNFEFAASAFNGNEESPQGPAVLAPSPASGVTFGSPGPTCVPEPAWCPGFGQPGSPTGGDGGSPPVTFPPGTGPTTETLTDANGSPVTLTINPGQSPITGPTTITTNGQTITVGPPTSNVQTLTEVCFLLLAPSFLVIFGQSLYLKSWVKVK